MASDTRSSELHAPDAVYRLAEDGSWIVVQVRGGFERSVARALASRGYDQLLPLWTARSRTKPPKPLFPGYIFCRYISEPRFRIVEIPSVIRLVGPGKVPLAVPSADIGWIQRLMSSEVYREPWKFLEVGERVVVVDGPLQGVEGVVIGSKRAAKLIVSLPILRRSVAVEFSRSDLAPIAAGNTIDSFSQSNIAGA
jgi:transcriptional antiterminator NusG